MTPNLLQHPTEPPCALVPDKARFEFDLYPVGTIIGSCTTREPGNVYGCV